MIINHPLLGPRDGAEFVCLGDASLINRPDPDSMDDRASAIEAFHDYLYLRDNPAGTHRELWYHEQGDRSWLVVTRNTLTHEVENSSIPVTLSRSFSMIENFTVILAILLLAPYSLMAKDSLADRLNIIVLVAYFQRAMKNPMHWLNYAPMRIVSLIPELLSRSCIPT